MKHTIKKHKDFLFGDAAPTVRNDLFIAKVRPAKIPGGGRYGLVVTKKTFKQAVKRNRAKRLLRVWIYLNRDRLGPDRDYVFIARHKILDAAPGNGMARMASALGVLSGAAIPK